jgi:hypothetical protein
MKVLFRVVSILMVLPALALIVFSSGCGGSRGGAVSVNGKVTYKGQPVTGGKVTLYPKGSDAGYSMAIGPDGNFAAGDLPKELVGVVTVTVDTKDLKDAPKDDPTDMKNLQGTSKEKSIPAVDPKTMKQPDEMAKMSKSKRSVYVEIPEKYADPKKSNLTLEIKSGKNEEKTITLE